MSSKVKTENAVDEFLTEADVSSDHLASPAGDPNDDSFVPVSLRSARLLNESKAPSSHSHVISNVAGLQSSLDAKAPSSHVHVIGQVSNLQSSLDAKVDSGLISDFIQVFIEEPDNKSYILSSSANFAMTLASVSVKLVSGTCNVDVLVGATSIFISPKGATSSLQSFSSDSGSNTVNINDRIILTVSSVSSPVDLELTLKFTRNL